MINSNINEKLFTQIGPYQHEIKCSQYSFLDHDSYVDGYLIREFNAKRVLESADYLGSLLPEDVDESIRRAVDSPKIKPYLIKKYKLK